MDFREYKRAAMRHHTTCKHLLEKLSTEHADNRYLMFNMYYLSGYIVETLLSYAYFSHIKHVGDIEDSEAYKKGFKTHNINTKVSFIKRANGNLNDIPFIFSKTNNKDIDLLFSKWSTDFRYFINQKDLNITQELLVAYFKHITVMFNVILKRF